MFEVAHPGTIVHASFWLVSNAVLRGAEISGDRADDQGDPRRESVDEHKKEQETSGDPAESDKEHLEVDSGISSATCYYPKRFVYSILNFSSVARQSSGLFGLSEIKILS